MKTYTIRLMPPGDSGDRVFEVEAADLEEHSAEGRTWITLRDEAGVKSRRIVVGHGWSYSITVQE